MDRRWLNYTTNEYRWVFEEYWYDALGRRVLVRTRKGCDWPYTVYPFRRDDCKLGVIRRTVWDGDQEIGEIQVPGGDGVDLERDRHTVRLDNVSLPRELGDVNALYGIVAYTHEPGIDAPLSIARSNATGVSGGAQGYTLHELAPFTIVPLCNERGQADMGSVVGPALAPNGQPCEAVIVYAAGGTETKNICAFVDFQAGWFADFRKRALPNGPRAWHGTLLGEKQDESGQMYRRNRYYDPQSGRFTQEDPLGLAGGMNLYGFAGGDPVNFSDPFGLCKKPNGEDGTEAECRKQLTDAQDAAIANPKFEKKVVWRTATRPRTALRSRWALRRGWRTMVATRSSPT